MLLLLLRGYKMRRLVLLLGCCSCVVRSLAPIKPKHNIKIQITKSTITVLIKVGSSSVMTMNFLLHSFKLFCHFSSAQSLLMFICEVGSKMQMLHCDLYPIYGPMYSINNTKRTVGSNYWFIGRSIHTLFSFSLPLRGKLMIKGCGGTKYYHINMAAVLNVSI